MLRTAFLLLFLIVSLSSSTSMLGKSIFRRQIDAQYCHAIEGFECKCSHYRVTCTNDRDLPSPINILQNEKHKYQAVELVLTAAREINVNDQTFEPVKELFKPDADNLDFRIKFEKFTSLQLSSPGIFNRVFPDNLPSNARKHLALEIYSPDVPPTNNPGLFKNLNADSLELYALYPFHGTFQQLFDGANIKFLRLSGGDIRSDVSQSFTGNIGRLELAKQANALSVQNFPVYPVHELTINAFYVTEFNHEHPPNYNNLNELRINTQERIPANAFRNFPNLHTLSITSEKDIDPQALSGLNNLEKLIVKDAKAPLELLNSLPNVKEFETNIEKLDDKTQCQLIEKLANGQVAVQGIPNGRECTCVSAYLDTAAGRTPCDAQHCDHSSCAVIKNNYDATARTFKAPPAIRRADGTDALHPRESRVFTAPFQVSQQDQEKLQKGIPPPPPVQQPLAEGDSQRPPGGDQGSWQQNPQENNQNEQNNPSYNNNEDYGDKYDDSQSISATTTATTEFDWNLERHDTATTPPPFLDDQQGGSDQGGSESGPTNQDGENRPEGDGTGTRQDGDGNQPGGNASFEGDNNNGTETASPQKKKMSWLPIIIIAAAIVGALLIVLAVLFFRKKSHGGNKGYDRTGTTEPGATTTTTARA